MANIDQPAIALALASTLDEIRAQAEPEVIEIPGFRRGTTLRVMVRHIDLTPHLLASGIGNPLLAAAQGGAAPNVTAVMPPLEKLLPVLDAVAREALVQPTFDEIAAVAPLTLPQKMAIFTAVAGKVEELRSFRGE